jgi:enediyne biosynthesis protein E4
MRPAVRRHSKPKEPGKQMNRRQLTRRNFLNFAAMAAAAPIFEVKPLRGIDFLLQNSPTPRKFLIETMPGGVALFDYNNDGLLDIFLMNGGRITEGLHVPENFERSNPRYWNRLYRQNRDGSFLDVTQAAGLSNAGNGNYGMGVAVGDYDNDANADLYVTSYGKNVLYHNNGDGTFTDVTAKAGVAGGGWSVSAGFFDYDNDGKLDLFVTRYMDWNADHNKICGGDWHTYCPPNAFPATTCLLFHNRGDGTFEDVTERSGLAAKKGRALGVAFADYDGDGFTDIFVSNDGMQQYLFHNNGNGTFTECALEAGVAFTADGKGMSGMGTVFQDYDNDGRPDVLVTVLPREIYSLYHNEGGGNFNYASLEAGLGAMTSMSSGWGVGLEDFDNDGWKDLFVAQGHVLDNVQDIDASLRYRELPLLAMNHNGHFERADSGVTKPLAARGVAFGDINNDGNLDAVISCLGGPPVLLLNRGGGTNHWLTISLQGTRSNRDGYGARVSVNGQTRVATSTGSYLGSNDKRAHFGLGSSEKAAVEILWPSGVKQILNDVRADQFLSIREPERS